MGRDASHHPWGKIGYCAGLSKIGQTHVGLSHGEYKNFAQNGDRATETGFGVVRDFESIGSNARLLVRTIDSTAPTTTTTTAFSSSRPACCSTSKSLPNNAN